MLNKCYCFIVLLFLGLGAYAQQADSEGSLVKWMTLKEAMQKMEQQPRPMIMDFYTDWCGWCKHMMKTTYANASFAQYINANFYPVKFDAESKDTVEFLGERYAPASMAPRTAHPLAVKLLQGRLSYPTTLFFNGYDKTKKEFRFSMVAAGYLDTKKMEPMLVFLLENVFRNASYEDFSAQFDRAFYDSTLNDELKAVKWEMPAKAFVEGKNMKKKKLVFIHTDWCNSCKVMQRTTFLDSAVMAYAKDKFELIDLNADMMDTVRFKGQVFVNQRTQQGPFHQLAIALSRNNFALPNAVFLDEDDNIIDAVSMYIPPKFMADIMMYYGDNIFKSKSWQDFMAGQEKAAKNTVTGRP